MPEIPAVSGRKLLRAYKKLGFEHTRTKGSHAVVRHPDGRRTVIPMHGGEDVPKGTLAAILRESEVSADQLRPLI